jgi:hypothetical protein
MVHFCSKGDLVNLKKVVEEQKLDVNEGDYDKRTGMKNICSPASRSPSCM